MLSNDVRASQPTLGAFALACVMLAATAQGDVADCPVPPRVSGHKPAIRTALASHPRAGSTWMRYLLEHATGLPCGVEVPAWANVLPHVGGEADPEFPNRDGVITKTHSSCYGCWPGAPVGEERFTIKRNSSSFTRKKIAKSIGKEYVKELEQVGACLFFPPATFETKLKMLSRTQGSRDSLSRQAAMHMDALPCTFEYEKAIILIRDPLDTVKSNYHYRTAVLGMRPKGTWGEDNYEFPFERGESFVKFYQSWRRFAEFNPTITVHYEALRANTSQELRRIMTFLELDVSDEMIECAVQASTVDKLKETQEINKNMNVKADMFFGSRDQTMGKEELPYPEDLLDRWEEVGLFDMRELYGYGGRPSPSGTDKPEL